MWDACTLGRYCETAARRAIFPSNRSSLLTTFFINYHELFLNVFLPPWLHTILGFRLYLFIGLPPELASEDGKYPSIHFQVAYPSSTELIIYPWIKTDNILHHYAVWASRKLLGIFFIRGTNNLKAAVSGFVSCVGDWWMVGKGTHHAQKQVWKVSCSTHACHVVAAHKGWAYPTPRQNTPYFVVYILSRVLGQYQELYRDKYRRGCVSPHHTNRTESRIELVLSLPTETLLPYSPCVSKMYIECITTRTLIKYRMEHTYGTARPSLCMQMIQSSWCLVNPSISLEVMLSEVSSYAR